MKFPHFFIDRPIFAAVMSILIMIFGAVAYPTLPVAQYPEIAPPTVVVSATYPGATSENLSETVSAPLEEAINGVEDMIYMSSSATDDGVLSITVTFKQGTDVDQAQVLVQNRVSTAEPRLPTEVRQIGVTVRKNSPDILMVATLISPDESLSQPYLSNYATLQMLDRLARLEGVGSVQIFGGRDYNMRVWIDPNRAAERNLTVDEIVGAVRAQNAQVSAGAVGQPPFNQGGTAFQLGIRVQGRLTTPTEFGDIIVKRDEAGRLTRLRDVARLELGAQDYTINAYLSGDSTVAIAVTQLPGSNALTTAQLVRDELETASETFPPGMDYEIPYNPTEYIEESIAAVQNTLIEAVFLVAIIILLFLQSWRAALIPITAIPVSLIGTLAFMSAFGFSLNNLSLFGLVLAIGIVVDDAIVVVENIERLIEEKGLSPLRAAHESMDEVGGALIATSLVLSGVFIPTAFIPGISGQFYQQFALTIVSATLISTFVSLTLSPAIAALLLKPKQEVQPADGWRGWPKRFANGFNQRFDSLSEKYGRFTARAVRALAIVGVVYALLIATAGWRMVATPSGFIPAQDQGYLIVAIQLPPGASLQRTDAIVQQAQQIALDNDAARATVAFAGLDGATFTNAPNSAAMFVPLVPQPDRADADTIANELRGAFSSITAANLLVIPPPPVRGVGSGGGFKMIIEDRGGAGLKTLEQVTLNMMQRANATPEVASAFTTFNTGTPRLYGDIDRERAERLGVPVEAIFSTLGTYLGSTFINDFNFLGRTYRVTAQADAAYRDEVSDIGQLKTRSASGAMVPLNAVMSLENESGAYRVVRYNLYTSAELQGEAARGYSSGETLARMEAIADEVLPQGFAYEWTELAYQQKQVGNTATVVFILAVVFIFLLLAAQYESLALPLAVILIVPMCLLSAILGVNLLGMDNNILTQIGLVVLIGLAAKNAILIVEFAKQNEEKDMGIMEAAKEAAAQRLRPIIMTSLAFILATLPLVIGTGPGSEMRQALGVAVFFGMIGVTIFGLLFTPSFYVIVRNLAQWIKSKAGNSADREPAEETES
ncbi:efflux RND transporter permease subunit [Parasphingorhabdus cellanae]|uniref:Efflux pump membrane transporter n=1 Tax=Parasphingorhabdus cellanae TaxID=2806553 RepID=A0ABX7SYT4_9SPHN|nr:multidrug efflux RND transporter permease subunit [Parasphingorhabdus cellanae]QTD54444.1 multidrug efflux RND transporter permease subunit [Parasphingorhabdus cellanae]